MADITARLQSLLRLCCLGIVVLGTACSSDADLGSAQPGEQVVAAAASSQPDQPGQGPVGDDGGGAVESPVLSVTGLDPTTSAPTSSTETSSTEPSTTASTAAETSSTAPTTAASSSSSTVQGAEAPGSSQLVPLRFESQVDDVSVEDLADQALSILNDERGWIRAGFTFVADPDAPYRVVLAEGPAVDALCLPLRTGGTVSCQNGPVVALNADRWRTAVDHWVLGVDEYRGYLVNHEVGHLIGQRHPIPRCPIAGRPAGVMEQQTGGLKGCVGNPWPRDWEIEHAAKRPVVYAPLPAWGPDPIPANGES